MLPIIGEASQEVSEAINTADVKEIADTVVSFISGTLTLLLKNIKLMVLDEPTEGIQPNVVSEIATTLFQKQVLLFVTVNMLHTSPPSSYTSSYASQANFTFSTN